jgi:murein L,D-transpeptidase YcbB/YkuD
MKISPIKAIAMLFVTMFFVSCNKKQKQQPDEVSPSAIVSNATIKKFFDAHPDFSPYKKDVAALYDENNNRYLWFDDEGRNEMAEVLYNYASKIEAEGVPVPLPYKTEFDKIFDQKAKASPENELLISSMYLFYAKKVFAGIDPKKSRQLGWYLPREKVSYADYLEQMLKENEVITDESENISMYYNLRKGLKKYRNLKASGVDKDAEGVSLDQRIKTIIVNMERCRWLSRDFADVPEYISVNIPSFYLNYIRDGKVVLESNVIVGEEANKTVVFSGRMSYLVFSPYWNVPESIVEKEIRPELEKDASYLEKQNMEWYEENRLRQRPGDDNSLGLIKFMFPNQNNIYLHDTPTKSLFKKEDRALSHGCVRVQKARELAVKILEGDKNWTPAKIDAAMHSGEEKDYVLKRKIPVYIAYFTAVADTDGNVKFYDDVYKRDNKLARVLYNE